MPHSPWDPLRPQQPGTYGTRVARGVGGEGGEALGEGPTAGPAVCAGRRRGLAVLALASAAAGRVPWAAAAVLLGGGGVRV